MSARPTASSRTYSIFSTGWTPRRSTSASSKNLVRGGAFDSIDDNRKRLMDGLEKLMAHAQAATQDRNSDQIGMFGAQEDSNRPKLPKVRDWAPMDRLKEEFDAIGFYLSAHPLDVYGKVLRRLDVTASADLLESGRSGAVKLAGTVIAKKERVSAKGNKFAFVSMSDASGAFEVTLFSEQLAAAREYLEPGQFPFSSMPRPTSPDDRMRLTAQSVEPLDAVAARTDTSLHVTFEGTEALAEIRQILEGEKRGKGQVRLLPRADDLGPKVEIGLPEKIRRLARHGAAPQGGRGGVGGGRGLIVPHLSTGSG